MRRHYAFTLAEILITMAILGVAAAITLPSMLHNILEKVRNEQVRTVKYKLTLATDKMKSLELIGPYSSTEAFVNELKKHLKILKICSNDELEACWPTSTINMPDDDAVSVSSLTTGNDIVSLALSSKSTKTMGIVTGDGTPMILLYSPACTYFDPMRTYEWSVTDDNKPVTNATTNCISAIFDINGSKGPNRLGTDVRTLNSLFGYKKYSGTSLTKDECNKYKSKLGIEYCPRNNDYFAGAAKQCYDIGMHLPDLQTLAVIAGAKFGRSDIGPYTNIALSSGCTEAENKYTDNVICVTTGSTLVDSNSAVDSFSGMFWSSYEYSSSIILRRTFSSNSSIVYQIGRDHITSGVKTLCVGD